MFGLAELEPIMEKTDVMKHIVCSVLSNSVEFHRRFRMLDLPHWQSITLDTDVALQKFAQQESTFGAKFLQIHSSHGQILETAFSKIKSTLLPDVQQIESYNSVVLTLLRRAPILSQRLLSVCVLV